MTHTAGTTRILLQELTAPQGWTALLLRQALPVEDGEELLQYRESVMRLLDRLPGRLPGNPESMLLQFSRCRPSHEVLQLRANARVWAPRFGVGVWLHQPAPTMWTREEIMTTPGRPRPIIERVTLLSDSPQTHRAVWQNLLGSGALLWLAGVRDSRVLHETTAFLRPRMVEDSLTSFPFYVPLLTAETLLLSAPDFTAPLDEQLPGVTVYLRESVEDGGLLVLVRQAPNRAWKALLETPLPFPVQRLLLPEAGG